MISDKSAAVKVKQKVYNKGSETSEKPVKQNEGISQFHHVIIVKTRITIVSCMSHSFCVCALCETSTYRHMYVSKTRLYMFQNGNRNGQNQHKM